MCSEQSCQNSIFKTAVLVYKFLHSGIPKYFEPFLIPRHSTYNTRHSQSDGMFLEVPHFASVFKSRKHFGLSFTYDAPMIWNDLPDEVHSANSLASFRSKLKFYLFGKASTLDFQKEGPSQLIDHTSSIIITQTRRRLF